MKIITIARTRDSARFVEDFCDAYYWASKILIADGGSTDDSKYLANQYPNVTVKDFSEKVFRNNEWRNPHGRHINFLIDWAENEGADWIIFDDVDCYPNHYMRHDFLKIFEDAEDAGVDFILANRVYIYGRDKYFKSLTCPKVHSRSI